MKSTQTIRSNCLQLAQRSIAAFAVVICIVLAAPGVMSAAISQGFTSTVKLLPGTLAALKNNQSNEVVAANTENSEGIVGVIITSNDATLAVNATSSAQVATSGSTIVFVTDIAGPIKAGDKITASPLEGVGMRATDSIKIVGVAEADFNVGADTAKQTVTSRDGQSHAVNVGSIPVQVQVAYYTAPKESTIIPVFLQQLSNTIAGKQVSPLRILLGTLIILAALVTVTIMLFSAVRVSILSVGRNPLAGKEIYKGLFQVFGMSIVILGVSVGITYLIMRF